jgi:serine/threonine protein kinase
VLEYLPESLDDLIMSRGPAHKFLMITTVAVKMLEVIEAFHKFGYLHRDIKPSNFRVKDNEVYLIDFGTVKSYLDDEGNHIKDMP